MLKEEGPKEWVFNETKAIKFYQPAAWWMQAAVVFAGSPSKGCNLLF